MDTSRIGEQVQGGRLPEDCQNHPFNIGIKFCEVNMLGVLWPLLTGTLCHGHTIFQRHTSSERACVDPYTEVSKMLAIAV